ncbi:MAG: glycosyltransferase [Bacteroidales bacterium]
MISVIVSIYKSLDKLDLILSGLQTQSFKDFELIVAEDNQDPSTKIFIQNARKWVCFPILHVCQADQGFRKNKILNQALLQCQGECVVFIDGDCIPHKHWLRAYNKVMQKDRKISKEGLLSHSYFYTGRRVELSKSLTDKILQTKNLKLLHISNLLYHRCKFIKRALYLPFWREHKTNKRGVFGCNMGGFKSDLLAVNGFDEDYQWPTVGEDSDLEWRLRAQGVQIRTVFSNCIVYHLDHKIIHASNNPEQILSRQLYAEKVKQKDWYCKNGIYK